MDIDKFSFLITWPAECTKQLSPPAYATSTTLNYSSNRSSNRSRGGMVGEEEGCGASGGSGEIVGAAFFFLIPSLFF